MIAGSCCTNNAIWRLRRDDVSNVADAFVIEVEVTEVGLACVYENAQQLEDCFV